MSPGHPDGAAGLKPVGDVLLYQSVVAAIPGIYLAAWWWLIPFWPGLAAWRTPYVALLPVAVAIEVLAFVLPMLAVHRAMQAEQRGLVDAADRRSHDRLDLQAQLRAGLADPATGDARLAARRARLADAEQEYREVEALPTWPVDASVRRRFSLNNAALLLPFAGYLLPGAEIWQRVADALRS